VKEKKGIAVLASFLILICVAWATPAFVAEKSPCKIGVNLELTGPWAEATKTVRNAMELEKDRINAAGEKRKL